MKKQLVLLLTCVLLLGSLWLAPVRSVWAAEEAPVAEEEKEPAGAGIIILMAGLGALVLVGGIYASNQSSESQK